MPDVDIVIINWNSGGQLAECLDAISLLRTGPICRLSKCIVVDNASGDGSADALQDPPFDLSIIRNATNRGFGAGCNEGAAVGHAGYILFLNPDVQVFPDTLVTAISFMEEARNQEMALLGVQLVDKECRVQPSAGRFPTPGALVCAMAGLDRLWPARFPPFVMTDWDHQQSREVDVLQGAFLLARRSAFERLQGFDERFFMYYEDVDLAYRAKQDGCTCYYLAEAQIYHRGGGATEQIKAERLAYWMKSRAQYAAKHFGTGAAIGIVIASLTLELTTRLFWNVIHGSWEHLRDTLGAYRAYVRALPVLRK